MEKVVLLALYLMMAFGAAAPVKLEHNSTTNLVSNRTGGLGTYTVSPEELAASYKRFQAFLASQHDGTTANMTWPASCPDKRSNLLGCHQKGQSWCWASGVTDVGHYLNPSVTCDDECKVVGYIRGKDCCGPSGLKQCGHDGGHASSDYVRAINYLAGHHTSYTYRNQALHEAELRTYLQNGPVLVSVHFGVGPFGSGHVVWVGGCGDNNNYWMHDPEKPDGDWVPVSYNSLLHYHNGQAHWAGSTYSES